MVAQPLYERSTFFSREMGLPILPGGGGSGGSPGPEGLEQDAIQRIRAVMIGKRQKLLNR
jgi:hypothetical protein